MLMNDWNGNGKHDIFDTMVDYQLINSHTSSDAGSDWWKWLLIAIAVGIFPPLGIVILIIAWIAS